MINDVESINISSPEFLHRTYMPAKYTVDGDNINPPITITGLPTATKSLVVIMEDGSRKNPVTHWMMWNIPPLSRIIENSTQGQIGLNDFGRRAYEGPCPETGLHYYHFKVYALDALLTIGEDATRVKLERKMAGHILDAGELVGLYKQKFPDPK